jgi:hypothetical protein
VQLSNGPEQTKQLFRLHSLQTYNSGCLLDIVYSVLLCAAAVLLLLRLNASARHLCMPQARYAQMLDTGQIRTV